MHCLVFVSGEWAPQKWHCPLAPWCLYQKRKTSESRIGGTGLPAPSQPLPLRGPQPQCRRWVPVPWGCLGGDGMASCGRRFAHPSRAWWMTLGTQQQPRMPLRGCTCALSYSSPHKTLDPWPSGHHQISAITPLILYLCDKLTLSSAAVMFKSYSNRHHLMGNSSGVQWLRPHLPVWGTRLGLWLGHWDPTCSEQLSPRAAAREAPTPTRRPRTARALSHDGILDAPVEIRCCSHIRLLITWVVFSPHNGDTVAYIMPHPTQSAFHLKILNHIWEIPSSYKVAPLSSGG